MSRRFRAVSFIGPSWGPFDGTAFNILDTHTGEYVPDVCCTREQIDRTMTELEWSIGSMRFVMVKVDGIMTRLPVGRTDDDD